MAPSRAPATTAASPPSPDLTAEEDDDPVTAEYDVYITPRTAASSLYILQFPTREREQPYNAAFQNAPSEMRIKPDSGFLEMDVPINADFYYDKEKAVAWGNALAKSKSEGAQGHGLAAGFAHVPGMRAQAGRGRGGRGQTEEEDDDTGNEAHKMRAQTLGGQIIKDEKGRPNYMIGAFRGPELHLTPITGLIQMRPQFHHIDAKTIHDRTRSRREREALASGDSSAPRPSEARIVQLVNKATSSNDAETLDHQSESTKEYLNKAMEENWSRLKFFDEEEEQAYQVYHDCLFHNEVDKAKRLVAGMGNAEFLDRISAPRLDPGGGGVARPVYRKGARSGGKGKGKVGVAAGREAEAGAETEEEEDDDEDEDNADEDAVVTEPARADAMDTDPAPS